MRLYMAVRWRMVTCVGVIRQTFGDFGQASGSLKVVFASIRIVGNVRWAGTAKSNADHTFTPWGKTCQKVGPGCDHRYAETQCALRRRRRRQLGTGRAAEQTSTANWRKPAPAKCAACGPPLQQAWRAGPAPLGDESRARHVLPFGNIEKSRQVALLESMQRGELAGDAWDGMSATLSFAGSPSRAALQTVWVLWARISSRSRIRPFTARSTKKSAGTAGAFVCDHQTLELQRYR